MNYEMFCGDFGKHANKNSNLLKQGAKLYEVLPVKKIQSVCYHIGYNRDGPLIAHPE